MKRALFRKMGSLFLRSMVIVMAAVFMAVSNVNAAPKPSDTMSNIALPPGANQEKKEIVCEEQKAYITCENIYNAIVVSNTMFGRKDKSTCIHPSLPSSSICEEQTRQVNSQIKDLCNGQTRCEIAASNDFLAREGTIICPKVYKYLEINYRCLPNSKSHADDCQTSTSVTTATESSDKPCDSPAKSSQIQEVLVDDEATKYHSDNTVSQVSEYVQPEEKQSSSDVLTEVTPDDKQPTEDPNIVNETVKKSQTPRTDDNREEAEDEDDSSDDFQRDVTFDDD